MRVARLLIYEGDEVALAEQLGHSMNEGVRSGAKGVTITCVTLPPLFFRFCETVGQEVIETAYLQGERVPPPMGRPIRGKDAGAESLAQEIHADMAADARRESQR